MPRVLAVLATPLTVFYRLHPRHLCACRLLKFALILGLVLAESMLARGIAAGALLLLWYHLVALQRERISLVCDDYEYELGLLHSALRSRRSSKT